MLKKFDEYVNEGLITDFQKEQEKETNTKKGMDVELSDDDKAFVLEFLRKLDSVGFPCVLVPGWFDGDKKTYVSTNGWGIADYFKGRKWKHQPVFKHVDEIEDSYFINKELRRVNRILFPDDMNISEFKENKVVCKAINDWFNKKFEEWKKENHMSEKESKLEKEKPHSRIDLELPRLGFILDYKNEIIEEIF